jgi:hypothetical protein
MADPTCTNYVADERRRLTVKLETAHADLEDFEHSIADAPRQLASMSTRVEALEFLHAARDEWKQKTRATSATRSKARGAKQALDSEADDSGLDAELREVCRQLHMNTKHYAKLVSLGFSREAILAFASVPPSSSTVPPTV